MKLARLMWKNALRNRRRTLLTILSVAVSIFLVSTLDAVLTSLYHGTQKGTSDLRIIVHRATSITQMMPMAYKQRIESVPGVKYVVGTQWFGGQYIDASNFFANFAVDTDDFAKVYDEFQIPPDQLAAWKNEKIAALVGEKLMETYHWKIGDRVTLKSTIFNINPEFVIRAVYRDPKDESQERAFYFHFDYFNELMNRLNQIGTFAVKVDSPEDVPKVSDAIDAMFHNTAYETKTETEQAFTLSFVAMLGNVKLLLTAISAAVVFTILLVAGNTMAMSIRERTSEVAVLKTLGFRRNLILLLLVGESLVIALLGGLVGALGAKFAYAFIGATFNNLKFLGGLYALVSAVVVCYGGWLLFAGTALRGVTKVLRYVTAGIGFLIGAAVGGVFYMGVGFVMNQGGFLADFGVSLATIGLCLGIAAGVGLVSAALPAVRASRTSIAEALRYVG